MVILDITKTNGTKCTRMCDEYQLEKDILYMWTLSEKRPHIDETIYTTIRTAIKGVVEVKEVKQYG